MKPSQLQQLLTKVVPLQENILVVGSPGVGKSNIVEAVTQELDMDIIITHPVVDDPTDYKGMPAVVQREHRVGSKTITEAAAQFLPFGDLWKMIEAKKDTVVFMDDLGQAPPAVQAAIMQLVLARRINGHELSPYVRFVAATNRRQDKAAVGGLITPLLDRFTTVVTLEFDLDDWVLWGINNDVPPVLLAFARFKPGLMNKFEANKDMKKSPTPRSVAGLGRLVKAGIDDLEVLAGAVGEGFATEFLAFYRVWLNLPDVTQIYLNPDKAVVPDASKTPDVMFALMGMLAHHATPANFDATCRYLNRVPAEFSMLCMRDAIDRNKELATTKSYIAWAMNHKQIFGHK